MTFLEACPEYFYKGLINSYHSNISGFTIINKHLQFQNHK